MDSKAQFRYSLSAVLYHYTFSGFAFALTFEHKLLLEQACGRQNHLDRRMTCLRRH
jgi:hypothetical protein